MDAYKTIIESGYYLEQQDFLELIDILKMR